MIALAKRMRWRDERPLGVVPRAIWAFLAAGMLLQGGWHALSPAPQARAQDLPAPPPAEHLKLFGLGDAVTQGRLLQLWLQSFDNQPGISIPFRELDYDRVAAWLGRILELDPRGYYPLLAAIRIYGEVADPPRQRRMIAFTRERFLADPDTRWPWMAHAVYIAKHRLEDLPLALEIARELADHATGRNVPSWARQMHVFVLEDMGEIESAKVLLGGLIESGQVTDPHELWFLSERLRELEQRSAGEP